MVQAAVDHQILASPGLLAIDNPGDVNATFAHNVPAEFDHHLCVGKPWIDCGLKQFCEFVGDGGQVQRLILVEIWDAEAAAQIDIADRWSIARPASE